MCTRLEKTFLSDATAEFVGLIKLSPRVVHFVRSLSQSD